MICEMQGKDNMDEQSPPILPSAAEAPKIKSHMTAAVLTTIFFGNWIFGIPAIVFSRECETEWKNGQYEIAQRFSRRSLTFICVGSALSLSAAAFAALALLVLQAVL